MADIAREVSDEFIPPNEIKDRVEPRFYLTEVGDTEILFDTLQCAFEGKGPELKKSQKDVDMGKGWFSLVSRFGE